MRLKFTRTVTYKQADPTKSVTYEAGKEYDVDDSTGHGQRWLRRGAAIEVEAKSKAKAADVPSPVVDAAKGEAKGK